MLFRKFRAFFSTRCFNSDGTPATSRWIANDWEAVCCDPNSSRVFAYIWHDGCGKFYPTIYLSISQAMRLLVRERVIDINLRSIPTVTLEMSRLKCSSIDEAINKLEEYLEKQDIV